MRKFEEIVEELKKKKENREFLYITDQNVDAQPFTDEQFKRFQEIHFDNVYMKNKTIASMYQMISSDKGQRELTEFLMGWGIGSGGFDSFGVSDGFDDLLKKAKNGTPKDRANLIIRLEDETQPLIESDIEVYLSALLTTKDVYAAADLLETLYNEDLLTDKHYPKNTYIMRDALWVLDAEGVKDINRGGYLKKPETEESPIK